MHIINEPWHKRASKRVAKSFLGWLGYDSVLLDGTSYISTAVSGKLEDGRKLVQREGVLTWERMWQVYRKNATVRACVDTRISEVLILNWTIKKQGTDLNPRYMPDAEAKKIIDFLKNPNQNEESLFTLFSKMLRDLLVYDAACLIKVRNARGKLVELLAQDASKVRFIKDEKGFLVAYRVLDNSEEGFVDYEPKDVIYLRMYASTNNDYGMPAIESLVVEIATALNALGYNARYFTENEIPDGVLAIDEIDDDAYNKAKSSFRRTNLREHAIRILANAKGAQWISFRGNNKDMQFKELIDMLDERIMYVFMMNKNELGLTDTVNRSVAEVQAEIFTNKGIRPILALLEYHLTTQLIQSEFNLEDYEFVFVPPEADEMEQSKAKQSLLMEQYDAGLLSWNEFRRELGRPESEEEWAGAFYVQMGKTTVESIFQQAGQTEGGAGGEMAQAGQPTNAFEDGTIEDLLGEAQPATDDAEYSEDLTGPAPPSAEAATPPETPPQM